MRKMRLNYFDMLYEHSLRIKVREDFFALTGAEIAMLGKALDADLDRHEQLLRTAFASFVNSIVADFSVGRRLHLSNYLSDLATTAEHLVDLIEQPSNVSDEYQLVYYQLTSNWDKASSTMTKRQISDLAKTLRILFADAVRIASDHPTESRAAGRKPYTAARELLLSLRSIAMRSGVDLSNNRNRLAFQRFKRFATIAIGMAASKGEANLQQLKLPDEIDRSVRKTLVWQERLIAPRFSWHLREALKEVSEQKSK